MFISHCRIWIKNTFTFQKQNAMVSPFKTVWKGHGLKALEDLEP